MLLKRERCLEKIRPFYDLDIIKVLVGSRRAGKSKVLELIINELKEKGVDEQDILYRTSKIWISKKYLIIRS